MNANELKLEIDQASLLETLALVEQIGAAATQAKAAIGALGVVQAPDFVVGELVADETPGLILAELRAQTKLLEATNSSIGGLAKTILRRLDSEGTLLRL